MAGSASVPNTFGSLSGNVGLNLWDQNYTALVNYLNDPTNRVSIGVDSGVANGYVITPTPALPNYTNPALVWFIPGNSNTASSTANVSGKGGLNIYKDGASGPALLAGGEIVAGNMAGLYLDPTLNSGAGGFHLINPVASGLVARGYIDGLTLSRSSGTVLGIAAGQCTDSTRTVTINLGAFTKSTAGSWVAGSGNNGMGTGVTVGANQWLHAFAIINGGSADAYLDTSISAANKPAGTTAFRYMGSVKTDGSSAILAFTQNGDTFVWTSSISEFSGTWPTTITTLSLGGTPPGVIVEGIFNFNGALITEIEMGLFMVGKSGLTFGNADARISVPGSNTGNAQSGNVGRVTTNSTPQIQYGASAAATSGIINTIGYVNPRGRNA